MKMLAVIWFVLIAAALGLAGGAATPARAGTSVIDFEHFRGQVFDAGFNSSTASVATSVYVLAGDQFSIQFGQGNKPVKQAIYLNIYQSSIPFVGDYSIAADCFGTGSLKISHQLSEASLRGSATCFNSASGTNFDVSVDLSALGTGELTSGATHNHVLDSGLIINEHFSWAGRDAEASGTVSDGNQNFTPDASNFAGIGRSNHGIVAIQPPGQSH